LTPLCFACFSLKKQRKKAASKRRTPKKPKPAHAASRASCDLPARRGRCVGKFPALSVERPQPHAARAHRIASGVQPMSREFSPCAGRALPGRRNPRGPPAARRSRAVSLDLPRRVASHRMEFGNRYDPCPHDSPDVSRCGTRRGVRGHSGSERLCRRGLVECALAPSGMRKRLHRPARLASLSACRGRAHSCTSLVGLFGGCAGIERIVPQGEPLPAFDTRH
jgi:hypothetical protein